MRSKFRPHEDNLSLSYLKEWLYYDPETGYFTWLKSKSPIRFRDIAGSYKYKYGRLTFNNYVYSTHRLAFFYMTGEWPKDQLDHIDGNSKNDKWINLREATRQENQWNRKVFKNNQLGEKNIRKSKEGKYRVVVSLGSYFTIEEAIKVRNQILKTLHKEFAHESVR